MRVTIGVISAVVVASVGLYAWRYFDPSVVEAKAPVDAKAKPAAGPKLAPSAVLSIDPSVSPATPSSTVSMSPIGLELASGGPLKALFDRLRSTPDGRTAEGLYALAMIHYRCATLMRDGKKVDLPGRMTAGRRDAFTTAISEKDPHRERRIAAFDRINADRCAGLGDLTMTSADYRSMMAAAAEAGDPKARMRMIATKYQDEINAGGTVTVAQEDIDTVKQVAASRDPAALVMVGEILLSTYPNMSIRVGPSEEQLDNGAFIDAWLLAACDLGYPCGATSERVVGACAYSNQCDATSVRDQMFYYGHSPRRSQLTAEYLDQVQRIVNGGPWDYFQFVPRPTPIGALINTPPVASKK